MCAELGDVKRIRAGRGNVTLAIANCVVTRQPYEFEVEIASDTRVRVVRHMISEVRAKGEIVKDAA